MAMFPAHLGESPTYSAQWLEARLHGAREKVCFEHPFLRPFLGSLFLEILPHEAEFLIGSDGLRLLINARLVGETSEALLGHLLYHEAAHLFCGHHLRREKRDGTLWSLACDMSLASMLEAFVPTRNPMDIWVCKGMVGPQSEPYSFKSGLSPEEYYELLTEHPAHSDELQTSGDFAANFRPMRPAPGERLGSDESAIEDESLEDESLESMRENFDGDDDASPIEDGTWQGETLFEESLSDEPLAGYECESPFLVGTVLDSPELNSSEPCEGGAECASDCSEFDFAALLDGADSELSRELAIGVWSAQVADVCEDAKRQGQFGRLPAWVVRVIKETGIEAQDIDWRVLLRRYFTDIVRARYTYNRPNRRLGALSEETGVLFPSRRSQRGGRGAIVLDTSGSMPPQALEIALREIENILLAYPDVEVELLMCDTMVKESHRRTFTRSDFPLRVPPAWLGGGGTNLAPALALLGQERHGTPKHPRKLSWCIVVSDMEWDVWRATDPLVPTFWLSAVRAERELERSERPGFGLVVGPLMSKVSVRSTY